MIVLLFALWLAHYLFWYCNSCTRMVSNLCARLCLIYVLFLHFISPPILRR
uniref:Uncharacterized protein n=1 Tax=Kalanchoe fedtschenkoi TaxID=63787 RepID=A0A7N0RHD8_KALFE